MVKSTIFLMQFLPKNMVTTVMFVEQLNGVETMRSTSLRATLVDGRKGLLVSAVQDYRDPAAAAGLHFITA